MIGGRYLKAAALRVPDHVITSPFLTLVAAIGILGWVPVILRAPSGGNLFTALPTWMSFAWAALMLYGGLRTACGLKSRNFWRARAGASMVSVMAIAYGLKSISLTSGEAGWLSIIFGGASLSMIIAQRLYCSAVNASWLDGGGGDAIC